MRAVSEQTVREMTLGALERSHAQVAVSVSGWGQAAWGSRGYCINAELFRNWASPIVDPSTPISSGTVAPRSMVAIPGLPEGAGGAVVIATLATLRRRRDRSLTA